MKRNYDSICCFRSSDQSDYKRVCWEITTGCNLNCYFCHRSDKETHIYDVSALPKTIELLKKNGIKNVIISGGEPLLHPKLLQIIQEIKENDIDVDLCTNGTLINQYIIEQLSKYLSEISISIDGYTADRHEKMRGAIGSFDKTVKGIKQLVENGFEVHTTTVVDADFCTHILDMVSFLDEIKVKSVAFLGLIPIGAGNNALFSSVNQKELNFQLSRAREQYNHISINTKQLLVGKSDCTCGAGTVVFGMGTDGLSLYPCLLTKDRTGFAKNKKGEGLCPGSKYLTQERRKYVE